MKAPETRADELLKTWTEATARPIPDFRGASRATGRHMGRTVALVLVLVVLVFAVLGTLVIGGVVLNSRDDSPSAQLAGSAVRALATTPGVQFKLTISTHSGDGSSASTNAAGVIDFFQGRFSGTADGGSADAPMFLFGGPTHGGVIVADGLFVQTEGQPWVHVPDSNPQLDAFVDPSRVSRAFQGVLDASTIDPAIRFAPCGARSCRAISVSAPPNVLFDAETLLLGSSGQRPPADFGPTTIELLVDPATGFPVRMSTTLKAGSTSTEVSLDLARLDPVPSISPPVR